MGLVHHLSGTHAARPSGPMVPFGALYSCSDHGLIYIFTAADWPPGTWSTWATLGGGAGGPGLAASPDIPPASPDAFDDEFDATDTTDPITGWTTLQTPTVIDRNSTAGSHLYLKKTASNASTAHVGVYKAWTPSAGDTITCKVTASRMESANNYMRSGMLFLGEATPGKLILITYVQDGSGPKLSVIYYTAPGVFSSTLTTSGAAFTWGGGGTFYYRVRYNSSTSIDYMVSKDGWFYTPILVAHNPGFTIGCAGLAIDPANTVADAEAIFDWIRKNWTPGT